MPKECAQPVQNQWVFAGKKCVQVSTGRLQNALQCLGVWVNTLTTPHLHTNGHTGLSTPQTTTAHLLLRHLYPFSTAPIIITTKEFY